MTDQRKRYDGAFKAKVVLESFKNEKTLAELGERISCPSQPDRPVEEAGRGKPPQPL